VNAAFVACGLVVVIVAVAISIQYEEVNARNLVTNLRLSRAVNMYDNEINGARAPALMTIHDMNMAFCAVSTCFSGQP
jgi:hypothetical protein